MHRLTIASLLMALAGGCAGGDPSAAAMLEELCADPARFDGATVRLPGPLVVADSMGGCTAAGCGGDACCNACTYDYVVPCGAGAGFDSVLLWGSLDLDTPVLDAADWGSVHLSPGDKVTTLGCVGDSCGPGDCTPVEPSRILWVEGTVSSPAGVQPTVTVTDLEWE